MEICADKGIDPEKTQIHSRIDAFVPKKNKILGFPKLRVYDIIGMFQYLVFFLTH